MIGLSSNTLWAAGTIKQGIPAPMLANAVKLTGPSAIPLANFDIVFAVAGQSKHKSTRNSGSTVHCICSEKPEISVSGLLLIDQVSASSVTKRKASLERSTIGSPEYRRISRTKWGTSIAATEPVTPTKIRLPFSILPLVP